MVHRLPKPRDSEPMCFTVKRVAVEQGGRRKEELINDVWMSGCREERKAFGEVRSVCREKID